MGVSAKRIDIRACSKSIKAPTGDGIPPDLLERDVSGIVPDHMADQRGIGQAVGDVQLRADLVCHGVADAKEGVCKCHAGNGGGVVHFLTGQLVSGAIRISTGKVLEEQDDSLALGREYWISTRKIFNALASHPFVITLTSRDSPLV